MKKLIPLLFLIVIVPISIRAQEIVIFPTAKSDTALKTWNPIIFKDINPASYSISVEDSMPVIKGISNAEASGLGREVQIDINEYPFLEFEWKVDKLPTGSNPFKTKGDDYGARIYITFKYEDWQANAWERIKWKTVNGVFGVDVPLRSLNYIWTRKAEQNQMMPNPYTGWVVMFAVESGDEGIGERRVYRRNILEDYLKAFDEKPSKVTGVVIMADADNSKGEAEASWYKISFKKQ